MCVCGGGGGKCIKSMTMFASSSFAYDIGRSRAGDYSICKFQHSNNCEKKKKKKKCVKNYYNSLSLFPSNTQKHFWYHFFCLFVFKFLFVKRVNSRIFFFFSEVLKTENIGVGEQLLFHRRSIIINNFCWVFACSSSFSSSSSSSSSSYSSRV